MNKTIKILFFALLLTTYHLRLTVCNAAFEPIPIGARPAGLGGAYTAISDDVYSVYYNPAGLSLIPRAEFTTQYSQMYSGLWDKSSLSYSFIAVAQPLKFRRDFGTIAISILNFTSGSFYKENTIALSYGKNFTLGGVKKLDLGFSLKSLSIGYGQDDYTYDALNDDGITASAQTGSAKADSLFEKYGFSKSAMAFDLGVKYALFTNYKIGFMIANLNEPNIALDTNADSKLSRVYNLGITHSGGSYSLSIDLMSKQFNKLTDSKLSIAGEKNLPLGFCLRSSLATGSRELNNIAFGFGYKTSGIQLDYAMEYPISGIRNTIGNHKVSLILRFGPIMHIPDETGALQVALAKEQDARAKVEEQLTSAYAEIDKLRKELEQLLKRPTAVIPIPPEQKHPEEKTTGKPSAEPAPKVAAPAIAVPSTPATLTTGSIIEKQYYDEFEAYRKSAGRLLFGERLDKIRTIVNRFRNKKIDISSAENEYKILAEEQKTQITMYSDSLTYYRKMVAKGIDNKTKIDLLKKIINRYEQYGIDVSEAQTELNGIK